MGWIVELVAGIVAAAVMIGGLLWIAGTYAAIILGVN